ncbi:MAG: ABC transporter substrate-binding protein [Solirubrobacteraceae bacterium]
MRSANAARLLLAAVAVASLLAFAGCGRGAAGDDEQSSSGPLKVALITDSSGAVASFGKANINGVRLAIDELNAAGGVGGRKVELIARDSKATPETGVQLTRDAILRDKVNAVFGPVSSGVAVAMTDVAERFKTPIFFHTANTQALTGENFHKYAFQVTPNTTMEGRANAVQLAKTKHRRWAIIAPDYEFGHAQSEAFEAKLKELNPDAKVVKRVFPELGETDQTPFITSLLAAKPDAVYGALFAGDILAFTKQAKPLGFFDKTFFTSLYDTDALSALGETAPLGVRGYSRAPFFAIDNPAMEDFVKRYRDRFDDYPSDWAIMAYDAVKLWAAGVEEGGAKADELVSALEDYEFDSLRGKVTIRAADHQASVPVFSGTVAEDAEVGFPTYEEPQSIPGDEVWLSEDEVAELQAKGPAQ